MGAGRTEVARALVGADPSARARSRCAAGRSASRNPAEAARHRIGYLSEDRKHLGLLLEQDVKANVVLSSLAERFQRFGFVRDRAMRAKARELVGVAADQDAVGRPDHRRTSPAATSRRSSSPSGWSRTATS